MTACVSLVRLFTALALLFNAQAAWGAFSVPALTGPVNDYAGVLSAASKTRIEDFLRHLKDNGGSQITVLTVKDLGGVTVEEAAIKTTDAWKLGTAKDDNGVLLLVAAAEHALRIEVGQGLEGVLPDSYAKRIIDDVIIPEMRADDYSRGILRGVNAIVTYTDPKAGQIEDDQTGRAPVGDGGGRRGRGFGGLPFGLKALVALIVIIWIFSGGGGGGYRRRRGIFWMGGMGGGGGFGGGGGGWSGGGGGFSGGGASGKW